MCSKCDESLAPVVAALGELTAVERIAALTTLGRGYPLEAVIHSLKHARDNKLHGSAANPYSDEQNARIAAMSMEDIAEGANEAIDRGQMIGTMKIMAERMGVPTTLVDNLFAGTTDLKDLLKKVQSLQKNIANGYNADDVAAQLGRELTPVEKDMGFELMAAGMPLGALVAHFQGDKSVLERFKAGQLANASTEVDEDTVRIHVFQVADAAGNRTAQEFVALADFEELEELLNSSDLADALRASQERVQKLEALLKSKGHTLH